MHRSRCVLAISSLVIALATGVATNAHAAKIRVALLDLGETPTARKTSDTLWQTLLTSDQLTLTDRDESRAAARGVGYAGSLNMTLQEARDLGAAMGCDFFITGDAQTLRRSSSARPVYYEAYASVFLVSGRTGRLVLWDRPSFDAAAPEAAEKLLIADLDQRTKHYLEAIRTAQASERAERIHALELVAAVIEEAPDDEVAASRAGIRLPQPYRRLRPAYPDTASRADAEATVDVRVDIDSAGEVSDIEVVRWAGFGLDDAAINTVRQLHFRPAIRDTVPIPIRVLLRYNFRRPNRN